MPGLLVICKGDARHTYMYITTDLMQGTGTVKYGFSD